MRRLNEGDDKSLSQFPNQPRTAIDHAVLISGTRVTSHYFVKRLSASTDSTLFHTLVIVPCPACFRVIATLPHPDAVSRYVRELIYDDRWLDVVGSIRNNLASCYLMHYAEKVKKISSLHMLPSQASQLRVICIRTKQYRPSHVCRLSHPQKMPIMMLTQNLLIGL